MKTILLASTALLVLAACELTDTTLLPCSTWTYHDDEFLMSQLKISPERIIWKQRLANMAT